MAQQKYIETIDTCLLQEYPFLENAMEIEEVVPNAEPFQFQDDNASCHRAKKVKDWKEEKGIISFKWPSSSPDLSIIENIWAYVEDRLYERKETLKNAEDAWERTQEIWRSIEIDFIRNLYKSLPDRMIKLKNQKGGPINF